MSEIDRRADYDKLSEQVQELKKDNEHLKS